MSHLNTSHPVLINIPENKIDAYYDSLSSQDQLKAQEDQMHFTGNYKLGFLNLNLYKRNKQADLIWVKTSAFDTQTSN